MEGELTMPEQEFWKRKLMAYLHDPPCKCLDYGPEHEETAWSFCENAGMGEEDKETFKGIKDADHYASAADRFTFPKSECSFNFYSNPVAKHPLGGSSYKLKIPYDSPEGIGSVIKILKDAVGAISENLTWEQKFFLHWRRWIENAVDTDNDSEFARHLAYYPADTRLPDHSIWNHMCVTSAFEGTRNKDKKISPSFLVFTLGPVQDFISQAESTRDLWAGSYLLSWLTAHAAKAISDKIGPDNIISPKLRGQGIFDLLYKGEIYDKIKFKNKVGSEDTLWQRMYPENEENLRRLLSPTLPNRFLAFIPADMAEELGKDAEKAVKTELKEIAKDVWNYDWNSDTKKTDIEKKRFFKQVEFFPQITWQVFPWLGDIGKAMNAYKDIPVNSVSPSPYENMNFFYELATKKMDIGDRDERYYSDNKKDSLNNVAFTWQAQYAMADYLNSARRNTRDFAQFITDEHQAESKKDFLSGKEETIGHETLGAINLIKRHFAFAYLRKRIDFDDEKFKSAIRFDSTRDIANNNNDKSPYIAIIAMDGDGMGKWISGENCPKFIEQLADGSKPYFNDLKLPGLPDAKRLLSPSYHLQFSEALANFAYYLAEKVIYEFGGQLIYAGGDDVLAMLPADKALKCARTLRSVFRGEKGSITDEDERKYKFAITNDGFIAVGEKYQIVVPGLNADVSCGIAIAHCQHPLQHIVNEAMKAEKRAKNEYGRSAFAINLIKRGGETIHWGAKWPKYKTENGKTEDTCPAIELYEKYCEFRSNFEKTKKAGENSVSGRFPYVVAERLKPYQLGENKFFEGFNPRQVVMEELKEIFDRQGGSGLKELCEKYLVILEKGYSKDKPTPAFADFANLFLTAAFIERERGE